MSRTVQLASVEHAHALAIKRLPPSVYEYFRGGRGTRRTLRANLEAFDALEFQPRAAAFTSPRSLDTTILGRPASMPVVASPAGLIRLADPDAELAVARATRDAGIPAGISTFSGHPIENIRAQGDDVWFQLYLIDGRRGGEVMIDRAQRAGCRALIVTVDLPVTIPMEEPSRPVPERVDLRTCLQYLPEMITHPAWALQFLRGGLELAVPNMPPGPGGATMSLAEATRAWKTAPATWADFAWIRAQWKGPLVIKGVLSADDARRALDAGADAISVSNHGGNSVDGVPASISVLPDVVAAVGSRTEVYLDSGVRRGADVVRALALGARAVLIGRAYIWGLAAGGEPGVRQILELFRRDIDATLGLLGCPSVQALDPGFLRRHYGDTEQGGSPLVNFPT